MDKYTDNGYCIEINLEGKGDYYITAFIKPLDSSKKKYNTTLLLSNRDTCTHWTVEEKIATDNPNYVRHIKSFITDSVKSLNAKGYFDEYIKRFEEDIRLMCVGIETEENKTQIENK